MDWAKRVAVANVRKPLLETSLRRWWVRKYQLPWTHELAQASTYSDLLVEFYEDYYSDHPEEARKVSAKDGEVVFTDTGDPLLDKWEEELSKGVIPDMEEGLSSEEKEKLRKERELSRRARKQVGQLGFEENYGAKPNPQFNSKFVTPGSKEERELLRRSPRVASSQLLGNSTPTEDAWEDLLMGGTDG